MEIGETKTYMCECGGHLMLLRRDEAIEYSISIWKHGHTPASWIWRLRQVWRILRFGTPYVDNICLTNEDMLRFINDLKQEGAIIEHRLAKRS